MTKSSQPPPMSPSIRDAVSADSVEMAQVCIRILGDFLDSPIGHDHRLGPSGYTPLGVVAESGAMKVANAFIDAGANPCEQDGFGCTALHRAAAMGSPEMVRLLIGRGAHLAIDARAEKDDEFGHTPLTIAAGLCRPEVVRVLVEKGADTEMCAIGGNTPLRMTAEKDCHEAARILAIEANAKVNAFNGDGFTALMMMAVHDSYRSIRVLGDPKAGTDFNIRDKTWQCRTALHWAADHGNYKAAWELVKCGADINALCGDDSRTPLDLAMWGGHDDIVKMLRGKNAHTGDYMMGFGGQEF